MLVTFISQCEKKALNRTRRVLDAFAERIGERTWQTLITEDGLKTVKRLLRQTVTKNTAVACHWRRKRNHDELVWIVGNRRQFNAEGRVPVNSTQKNILQTDREKSLPYLPLIKALVGLAALLHDWGKATLLFQNKLKNGEKLSDPLRHEWISCLLLQALILQTKSVDDDTPWLSLLSVGTLNETELAQAVQKNNVAKPLEIQALSNLPPLASMIAWLILTHHRLPFIPDESKRKNFYHPIQFTKNQILAEINAEWGYANIYSEVNDKQRIKDCFEFPKGLLSQSNVWMKAVRKWSARLLEQQPQAQQVLANDCWRIVLQHARLCLMLGDHYYSSEAADKDWQTNINLFANTDKNNRPKQKLDEHLVKVSENGLKICHSLNRFVTGMDYAHGIRALKQKSPTGYEWQDQAVSKISRFRSTHTNLAEKGYGWFIVNMASTGCGKTIANAKIMRALADDGDSLRYILALGLRTLTLQTGSEYRDKLGFSDQELAVLIGSAAVKALYKSANSSEYLEVTGQDDNAERQGSESAESLLDEEVDFDQAIEIPDFLKVIIAKGTADKQRKNLAFLYAPILACTIDHMMAATETIRGGKYMLPYLRLLSSDLVIDEVDDFDQQDLNAIGRLVHLAGMLGRKVMLSSATIPPSLAEGFFNAYQAGWQLHSQFYSTHSQIACAWIDEYSTVVNFVKDAAVENRRASYQQQHLYFIKTRVKYLQNQPVRRKGMIVPCEHLLAIADKKARDAQYFEIIKQTVLVLHTQHAITDSLTGKKVSFGVIRVANILPCVNLAKHLLKAGWPEDYAPKIMAYHSQQILLLRHTQEQHLDRVLKRKEKLGETPQALMNPIIRKHLQASKASNLIFILVATPVEEIGRDHDFDWAIIEPSSYRSIIQLVGRVRRHRVGEVDTPNVAIMQYNLKALAKSHETGKAKNEPVFWRPGYETKDGLCLTKYDLFELINAQELAQGINAIPRIQQPEILNFKEKLADLEHQAIIDSLTQYDGRGADTLQGWLTGAWWLTALPQQINPFRSGIPTLALYWLRLDGQLTLHERDTRNDDWPCREGLLQLKKESAIDELMHTRLWLERDYQIELRNWVLANSGSSDLTEEEIEQMMEKYSKQYGEITIPCSYLDIPIFYSDQFGMCKF